jgi:hypothetical protein
MKISDYLTFNFHKFVRMDPGTVKIYSPKDVPRLRYIAGILLGEILGLSWEIVNDKRKLGKNPVINYSSEELKGSFRIYPVSLLFETGVRNQELEVFKWKGLPVFFGAGQGSDIPFDIFAASFFLISRYEEYLQFQPDQFGRFPAAASVAFRNGFLSVPVIDLWVRELARTMVVKFQNLVFRKSKFSSMVTIDMDEPFEYLGKAVLRSLGGMIRDIGKKSGRAGDRYRIVTHGEKDPWDVFDFITSAILETDSKARFFIPTGDRSQYDKNAYWKNEDFRTLVKKIISGFGFGLHPSFYASENADKLKDEYERLKKITSKETHSSRFHYIKLSIPKSYRNLLDAGIVEDYSMGYPDEPGFRAGVARPFRFYDIGNEIETSLMVFPFQVMDATLSRYKKLDPVESEGIISDLIDVTRKVGGTFISIWHNTSLLDTPEHKGWRLLFKSMLKTQQA